jgi:hypothetical protein
MRDRRAASRHDRVAAFRRQAGAGAYNTSLLPVGEHQARDGPAISNWYLREPRTKPTCFCCALSFSPVRRPGAFLTVLSIRSPQSGTAVSGCCRECWATKTTEHIEAAALALLRRQLGVQRFEDDP